MRRIAVLWSVTLLFVFVSTLGVARAHPLGNFTINHLAVLSTADRAVRVHYVLDIAEIPTFQIMHQHGAGETWGDAQLHAWGASESAFVLPAMQLDIDGRAVPLRLISHRERIRPGAGGLPLLYWSAEYTSPLAPGAHEIAFVDTVYADRHIGWKDVIVAPPQSEPTHELQLYPNALIGSPRRTSGVRYSISSGGIASSIVATSDSNADFSGSNAIVRSNALSDMFSSSNRTPLFILLTILAAFGLGALHAIEPGHGKALLAFTLVGSRATVKQAAILAASLTFAHTIGVLLLGMVLFFATGFVSESIYPWITLVSGIAIAIIGARNLGRYLRARNVHAHAAGAHVHAHGFTDDHHHSDGSAGHSHAIPGNGPIDFRAAVVAAMSGGVAPCPAAIVVMLAALRLHQFGYGVFLIVVFSLGLAAVLTSLGIAVVHGAAFLSRSGRFERLVGAGPLISAALISIIGAVMVGQGFVAQGVRAPVWTIAILVILAVLGYGFTPRHAHVHRAEEHAS